jgi:hypothetical protein
MIENKPLHFFLREWRKRHARGRKWQQGGEND